MEQGGARGEHSDRLIAEGVAAKSDRSPPLCIERT
jgi:hypothetical protein